MLARSARSARSALSLLALAAATATAAAFAVACSAPADSKKPLPVCDANDPTCSGGRAPSTDNQTHSDVPTDPVPAPDQATDDPASTSASTTPPSKPSSPEAGVDAAPVVGQFCQELATCCTDLGAAGYDTTMCKSVLSTNNEDACYAKHDSYKQSGDCT